MQLSHSVDLHLYRGIVPSSNSCKIHIGPKAALFPRTVVLLKAKKYSVGGKKGVFHGPKCLRSSGLNNV